MAIMLLLCTEQKITLTEVLPYLQLALTYILHMKKVKNGKK
jgi:hypothetical protein